MEPRGLSRATASTTGAARGSGSGVSPWAGTGPDARVGVLAALPEEAAPIRERLERERTRERPIAGGDRSLTISRGRLGEASVAVAVTGVGRRNARSGARALLRSTSLEGLVVVGVGGALSPGLEPGAVVLGRRVWLGADRRLEPRDGAAEWAAGRTGATPGTVVTVEELLHSPEQKRGWWQRVRDADPGSGPAIADMESGHYADVAEEAGVDWLVLRGVSDAASEALPAYLDECRDESGDVRRAAVARRAALHPTSVPKLLRLRKRVAGCARELAAGFEQIVAGEAR